MRVPVSLALLISALNGLGLTEMLVPAAAHDAPLGWKYPWSCCSNQDCKPVTGGVHGFIQEEPEGYRITVTGEVVPYADSRVKDSPDGEFHWCAHQQGVDAGHTICLFVPPKGF